MNNWKVVRRFVYELSSDTLTFTEADTRCISSISPSLSNSSSSSSIMMEVGSCRLESNCSSLSIRVGEFSNSFSFGVAMIPFTSSNNNNELFGERIDSWGVCIRDNKCVLGTCGEYFIGIKPIETGDILSLDIDLSRERIAMVINGALVQEWSLPSINYSSLVGGVTFEGKGDVDILPIDTPYEAITWVRQNIAPISSSKEKYKQIVSNLHSINISQNQYTTIGFPENSIASLPLNDTTFTLLDKIDPQQDVEKSPYLQDVADALGLNNMMASMNVNNTNNSNSKLNYKSKGKKGKNKFRKLAKRTTRFYKSNTNQVKIIDDNMDLSSLLAVPPSLIEPHHPNLAGSHIESSIEKLFPHLGIQRGMQSPVIGGGPRSRPKKNQPSRSIMPREKLEGDANLFVTGCDSAGGTGKLPVLFSSGDFMKSIELIPPILIPESDTTATTTVADKYDVDDMVSQSMVKLNNRKMKQLRGDSSMTVESFNASSLSASQYRDTLIHNVIERGTMKLNESHDIAINNKVEPSSPVEKYLNFIAKVKEEIVPEVVDDDDDKENIVDHAHEEMRDLIICKKNSMNMSLTRQGSISSIMSTVSRKMRKLLGIGPSKDRFGKKEHRFGAYSVEAPDVDPRESKSPSKPRDDDLWNPNPRLSRQKSSPKKPNAKPNWKPSGRLAFEAPPLPAIAPTPSEPEPESELSEYNNCVDGNNVHNNNYRSSVSLEATVEISDNDNKDEIDSNYDNESDTLDLFNDIKKLNRQVKSLPYGLSMVYSDPKRVKEMAKPSLRRLELNGLILKNDNPKPFSKLPLPLYLSSYDRLRKNDFHLSIEYCMHCHSHVTLKHDPRKYENMASTMMDLLKEEILDMKKRCFFELLPIHPKGYCQGRMKESLCIDCDMEIHAKDWYENRIKEGTPGTLSSNKSSSNPLFEEKFDQLPLNQRYRTGALEIQVAFKHPKYGLMVTTLHSKIASRNWPNPAIIIRRLKLFLSICVKDSNTAIIKDVIATDYTNVTETLDNNKDEEKIQLLHEKNEFVVEPTPKVIQSPVIMESTATHQIIIPEAEVDITINSDETNVDDNKVVEEIEKKEDLDDMDQKIPTHTPLIVQPTLIVTTTRTTEADNKVQAEIEDISNKKMDTDSISNEEKIDSKISNSVEIMGILKADTQDILEATQEQQEEQKATAETEMEKEPSY